MGGMILIHRRTMVGRFAAARKLDDAIKVDGKSKPAREMDGK